MLPQNTLRIAIVPCNTILHAETVAQYSPFTQITKHYIPANLAVFLGFNPGSDMIAQHFKNKGVPTLCWWIGTDIANYTMPYNCPTCNHEMARPVSPTNLYDYHWCPTEANKKELESVGIKATVQPVVQAITYPIQKVPKDKKKIMVYVPLGRVDQVLTWEHFRAQQQNLYMISEVAKIIEALPEVSFTIYGNHSPIEGQPRNVRSLGHIAKDQMPDLYADHNIYLRWTSHEGIAQSCMEAKQSGLQVITNQKNPHMIHADSVPTFIEAIKNMKLTGADKKGSKYYQELFSCKDVLNKWAKIMRSDNKHEMQAEYSSELNDNYSGLQQ